MKLILANLLLAFAWMALTGNFSSAGFLAGFLLGLLVLVAAAPVVGPVSHATRVKNTLLLSLTFLRDLVKSNLRVAVEVLSPRPLMRPAIIAIPLDVKEPASITLMANLITLTPGTLSVDVSPDARTLYVHAMYAGDVARAVQEIKQDLERRVKEVMES